MSYCEDFPCCGHRPEDPCDGVLVLSEPPYCDACGYSHLGACDQEVDEPDED